MTVEEEVKEYVKNAPPTHDFSHVERVYHLCMRLGKEEGADLRVLKLAALLHDIGRTHGDENHEIHGAEMAEEIMTTHGVDAETRKQVIHCIRTHRYRSNAVPETLEAKILYDADKLDAIGAIGVCRAYAFGGENGQKLYRKEDFVKKDNHVTRKLDHAKHTPVVEYKGKLSRIKRKMLTEKGRKVAEERDKFMKTFFHRLKREIEGKI
jgi:uncharacterized protein